MSIRPKWLRDICSILFSVYYIIYATEGDEKVPVVAVCSSHRYTHHGLCNLAPSISRCTNGGDAPRYLGEDNEPIRAFQRHVVQSHRNVIRL